MPSLSGIGGGVIEIALRHDGDLVHFLRHFFQHQDGILSIRFWVDQNSDVSSVHQLIGGTRLEPEPVFIRVHEVILVPQRLKGVDLDEQFRFSRLIFLDQLLFRWAPRLFDSPGWPP